MNNYSFNQIFIQITYCSFLESKKNEKTFGVTQTPNPGALGEVGQDHVILRRHSRERQSKDLVDMVVGSTRTTNKKRFCELWHKTSFFLFLSSWKHKHKTVSSVK